MVKILIVEDDLVTIENIREAIKNDDYLICSEENGFQAVKRIGKEIFDIIILDINLPGLNGFEITKEIKVYPEKYGMPKILMLTEKVEINDVVHGFEIGADDYLKKPFNPVELMYRVRKMSEPFLEKRRILRFEEVTIDSETGIVKIGDEEKTLSKREHALLNYIILNKGIVMSKEKIYEEIWGDYLEPGNTTVDMCLSRLRKKIPILYNRLENIKGMGYRLK
jgi:DNA-binding response OmpR family regulator